MYQELIETYDIKGIPVNVVRGDRIYNSPLPHHLKMGALNKVVADAKASGRHTIGAFCTKHGTWPFGLPHLAESHGMNSIVCFPATKWEQIPHQLLESNYDGYKLIHETRLLKPNMVNVNQSQAKKYIMEENDGVYIPFGCNTPKAVETLSYQLKLPVDDVGTLIVPSGSGVTLAAAIMAIHRYKTNVKQIVAVAAHAPRINDIAKTIMEHVQFPKQLRFIDLYKYDEIPPIECPWPVHPRYELKAFDWLEMSIKRLPRPIWFLNIGAPPS